MNLRSSNKADAEREDDIGAAQEFAENATVVQINEDDMEVTAELEEDEECCCVCNDGFYDQGHQWIECSNCKKCFHIACVGLTRSEVEKYPLIMCGFVLAVARSIMSK